MSVLYVSIVTNLGLACLLIAFARVEPRFRTRATRIAVTVQLCNGALLGLAAWYLHHR